MKSWPTRLVALASVAALLFAVADFVFFWNPIAAAPYLDHRHDPVFRASPLLGLFGLAAETVNGWIAALAYLAMRPRGEFWWSRAARFGLCLWGFGSYPEAFRHSFGSICREKSSYRTWRSACPSALRLPAGLHGSIINALKPNGGFSRSL
jgi:hypothetical protein